LAFSVLSFGMLDFNLAIDSSVLLVFIGICGAADGAGGASIDAAAVASICDIDFS